LKVKIEKNAEGRITVKFSYEPKYNDKIKSINGREWHPNMKYWSIPNTKENLERINEIFKTEVIEIDDSLPLMTSSEVRSNSMITTEIFPVLISNLPKLYAYTLEIGGNNRHTIGGKLAYRFKREFNGHWVWTDNRLVTDKPKNSDEMMKIVKNLWDEQPDIFKDLRNVKKDETWNPSSFANAKFVANGLIPDFDREINKILKMNSQEIGESRIERVCDTRGWVINGQSAISISIHSSLIYLKDLKSYLSTNSSPEEVVGLWVKDKTSSMKGEIINLEGTLSDHRVRLLTLTKRPEMLKIIEDASDNEIIVRIRSGNNEYEYTSSALNIILRMEDLRRFGIDAKKVMGYIRMEPEIRFQLVKRISDILINKRMLDNCYNSIEMPNNFLTADDVGFIPRLRFGNREAINYKDREIFRNLKKFGLYRKADEFKDGTPIRIGILNGLKRAEYHDYLKILQREFANLKFDVYFIGEYKVNNLTRANLETAVNHLQEKNPHLILAFLPDQGFEDEELWGSYNHLKSLTIGRGIASQVINESTLKNQFAIENIILGILGKTGNVPFILGEPLPYADVVVGIDIAREKKKDLPGSINATAIARIYFSDGEFVRYTIHDAPIEGETIPNDILLSLFPINEFKNKRVVIHRDGYFRGTEKLALKQWAQKIEAEFLLVEVIKTGSPRIYKLDAGSVKHPIKGTAFKIGKNEALLISSLPPFQNATPQPLRIKTEQPFNIDKAIHSVLSLTLLHYGSLRPPKLPVTIHYSDKIAYLALRGIKPRDLIGKKPYWL